MNGKEILSSIEVLVEIVYLVREELIYILVIILVCLVIWIRERINR